ncbi:tetratricopeptide repeat protein [Saccharicrinis sp. FJH2]|uniref:tetratricopeptide repeat-containing sensor histidine kinase n=1 Tax=Saccharicrinis sp. FJH65 TaxID=3344659 RepID=UPI0035F2EC9A
MIRLYTCFFTGMLLLLSLKISGETNSFNSMSKREQVNSLATQCWQNREKQTDKAIEYGMEGIKIAKEEGYTKELGKLYNYIGVIYQHYKFDISKAIYYYDLGLPYCIKANDSEEIAYLFNNLGDAFYITGNVPLALEYTQKSMDLFQKTKNERGIAYSYINMGELNRVKGEYATSLNYFNKAINIRKKLNDSIGIASAYLELGHTLFLMDKKDDALYNYSLSLEKNRELNNINFMAYSMQGIGKIYLEIDNIDSAIYFYHTALDLCKSRNNLSGIINSQLGMAKALALSGNITEGENFLNKALQNAKISGISRDILSVYKTRGQFYQQQNQYRKATEDYENYVEVYDSLFTALQYATLNDIRDRYLITSQLNSATETLKMKKKVQIYAIIFIIILIIFSVILFFRNQKISRLSSEIIKSNDTKDKIFSIISHDMISPFNILIGSSGLLIENLKKNDVENAMNHGQIIQQTSERTFQLISNLLSWARSQQKRIVPYKRNFDLSVLLHEVNAMFENLANYKNITVDIVTENNLIIKADKNLLQIVIANLLNNALKFSYTGEKVEMRAQQMPDHVKVSIKDHGIGIKTETLTMIFSGQDIESTAGTKNERGTGLGLILCREFIEMHGGTIHVKSKPGEGSEFWFNIPA